MTDGSIHLDIQGIGKTYGSTRALDDVSVAIRPGTVHALVGENGAGKSTLGRILSGVVQQDQGSLVLRGTPVAFRSPREALVQGIALVAQELALVPALTAAQNVFLGVEPRRASFIDRGALTARYRALAEAVGFEVPPDARVGSLPISQRQQVEILRALARDADLLVLDEPTASLSAVEAERLHGLVRDLAAGGRTVVLVSHFLSEVLALADTVTVLRDGRVVRTGPAAEETESSLIAGMLGRSSAHTWPVRVPPPPEAPVVLDARDVVAPGVQGVSLQVHAGEIVALAGLVGAGRSELARAVFGAVALRGGSVRLDGTEPSPGPRGAIRAGMALIPESRKDDGLCLGRPIRENVSLASLPRLGRYGFVRRQLERSQVIESLGTVAGPSGVEAATMTLSGGNQQKVLFARSLLAQPRLLIADEPTRGIDIGAKREIYELLARLAGDGMAVLVISSEIEEVIGLAHRALVMRAGRVVTELRGDAITEQAILDAAFGMDAGMDPAA